MHPLPLYLCVCPGYCFGLSDRERIVYIGSLRYPVLYDTSQKYGSWYLIGLDQGTVIGSICGVSFSKIYFQARVRKYKGKEASSATLPGDQDNTQLKDNNQTNLLHLHTWNSFFSLS